MASTGAPRHGEGTPLLTQCNLLPNDRFNSARKREIGVPGIER